MYGTLEGHGFLVQLVHVETNVSNSVSVHDDVSLYLRYPAAS